MNILKARVRTYCVLHCAHISTTLFQGAQWLIARAWIWFGSSEVSVKFNSHCEALRRCKEKLVMARSLAVHWDWTKSSGWRPLKDRNKMIHKHIHITHLPSSTDLFRDAISYDVMNPKYLYNSQWHRFHIVKAKETLFFVNCQQGISL